MEAIYQPMRDFCSGPWRDEALIREKPSLIYTCPLFVICSHHSTILLSLSFLRVPHPFHLLLGLFYKANVEEGEVGFKLTSLSSTVW